MTQHLYGGDGYNVEVGNFLNKIQSPSKLNFANIVMFKL